uniref:Superoxide dismutase n=1 Tax=Nephromyces sp. MMRI TaxID=2496275 RepID=A0A3Q8UBW4_9APIC|nr:superoxide dismutase [Nephromyces sp. MMRI]
MFRSLCRLAHQLPSLPYKMEALQPYMSVETLEYHYGKHHAGYVQKLNQLIEGKADLEKLSLEQLIQTQSGIIFNQASQIWNHNFFWKCMIPNGKGAPSEILRLEIEKSFGSLSKFKETFSTMAAGHFGSGWIWLVWKNNRLELLQGHDSYTPIQDQGIIAYTSIVQNLLFDL